MTTTSTPRPAGFHSLTPYLTAKNAGALIDFLKAAFGAEEIERTDGPDGTVRHAALKIDDSILELSEARAEYPARPTGLHFYVPDVDASYARALQAGASSLSEPTDQDYGERGAGVQDPAGNQWYLATYRGR